MPALVPSLTMVRPHSARAEEISAKGLGLRAGNSPPPPRHNESDYGSVIAKQEQVRHRRGPVRIEARDLAERPPRGERARIVVNDQLPT